MGKLWTALRIAVVRLRFVLIFVAALAVAASWGRIQEEIERRMRPAKPPETTVGAVEYYCPMDPQVVRPTEGKCPICQMALSRRIKGEISKLSEGVVARLTLSPFRVQQAGLQTVEAQHRPLVREIETVGVIALDERRLARITSRLAGRIDKLFKDFTGDTVSQNEPLAWFYSPELVAAQQEYLRALKNLPDFVDAARQKLALWGVSEAQIKKIEEQGKSSTHLEILSPISGTVIQKNVLAGQYVSEGTELYLVANLDVIWMQADVYEGDLAVVKTGQVVQVRSLAYPGETFSGAISFIDPVLNPQTRTLKVRVDVSNALRKLKPGMYVTASIRVPLGGVAAPAVWGCCENCPEVKAPGPGKCPKCGMDLVPKNAATAAGMVLAIPYQSVIDSGGRKVVYVDRGKDVYEGVAVELGPRAGEWVHVLKGLSIGDRVATAGAFLLDAENRLNPAAGVVFFGAQRK